MIDPHEQPEQPEIFIEEDHPPFWTPWRIVYAIIAIIIIIAFLTMVLWPAILAFGEPPPPPPPTEPLPRV
ncbi:MAG: hypothetical protein CL610_28100 [Anaerolineaceae bacterium]|nr:hypothetical protein [Anaerolineaceae bacterium]